MTSINRRSFDSVEERAGSSAQADQLLRNMEKVCHHDLPNQLVVLQGLLKLLALEEVERLSSDGREYVRRLQNAIRQTSGLARFLKEMASVNARRARLDPVSLAGLAHDLQGALHRLHPDRRISFEWDWQVPVIVGDPRLLARAIVELYAGLAHANTEHCLLTGASHAGADEVELTFRIEERLGAAAEPGASPGRPRNLEERLEIILARAWLAQCGIRVELPTDARFSLVVANR